LVISIDDVLPSLYCQKWMGWKCTNLRFDIIVSFLVNSFAKTELSSLLGVIYCLKAGIDIKLPGIKSSCCEAAVGGKHEHLSWR